MADGSGLFGWVEFWVELYLLTRITGFMGSFHGSWIN